jgi:hypothetical protein
MPNVKIKKPKDLSRKFKKAAACGLVAAACLLNISPARTAPNLTERLNSGDCTQVPMASAPLEYSFAHNDYKHAAPLLEGLENGFGAFEIDLSFNKNGELTVGHSPYEAGAGFDLETLYLKPLQQLVRENGGHVYPNSGKSVLLMLDAKSKGAEVYEALLPLFKKYRGMLTSFENGRGKVHPRAVTIVMTGDQGQRSFMAHQKLRYAALDGTPDELGRHSPAWAPVISRNWDVLFGWEGKGPIPQDERRMLKDFAKTAHKAGQKLRFWSAPDNSHGWQVQTAAGVDFINTNRPGDFADWAAEADPQAAKNLQTKIVRVNCAPKNAKLSG